MLIVFRIFRVKLTCYHVKVKNSLHIVHKTLVIIFFSKFYHSVVYFYLYSFFVLDGMIIPPDIAPLQGIFLFP